MGYKKIHPKRKNSIGIVSFFLGLSLGVLLGAVCGLLSAPQRGDVARRRLANRAESTRDQVVGAVEDFIDRKDGDAPSDASAAI